MGANKHIQKHNAPMNKMQVLNNSFPFFFCFSYFFFHFMFLLLRLIICMHFINCDIFLCYSTFITVLLFIKQKVFVLKRNSNGRFHPKLRYIQNQISPMLPL